jgi:hypothetical protein
VRQNFLLPQYLKNWLMVFLSLEHPHSNLIDLTKG